MEILFFHGLGLHCKRPEAGKATKGVIYSNTKPKHTFFCDSGPPAIKLFQQTLLIYYYGGLDLTYVDSLQRFSSRRTA